MFKIVQHVILQSTYKYVNLLNTQYACTKNNMVNVSGYVHDNIYSIQTYIPTEHVFINGRVHVSSH